MRGVALLVCWKRCVREPPRFRRRLMMTSNYRRTYRLIAWLMAVAVFATPLSGLAQAQISYYNNKNKTQDEVKLGRQATAEVERQMPILRDEGGTGSNTGVWGRLGART